jgi:plastocyanin
MKNFNNLAIAVCIGLAFFLNSISIAQTTHIVEVSNFQFTPASITIESGDIVTFNNVSGFHNANGSTDVFPGNPTSFTTGSPASAPWTESVVLTVPGTYTYLCDIHTNMVGTIIVNSSEPPCENPYPEVTGLTSAVQANGVALSWDPIEGSIGCQVRVGPKNGGILGTKTIGGSNVSQFFIPGQFLSPGTTYDWEVRCGCSQSPVIAGPWASADFAIPAGAAITSFPNPTSNVSNVTFSVASEGYATLEVYDMTGRSIESLFSGMASTGKDYRFSFSGSGLPEGVYIYRLSTETETVIEKIMISR